MSKFADIPLLTYFRRVEILAVLEQRDFRCLAAAYIISNVGDAVYFFAITRLAYDEVGAWRAASFILTAAILPVIIMPPLAGVLADRLNRKSLMLFSQFARVPVLAALILVGHLVGLHVLVLAAAAFLITSTGQLFYPSRAAMLPNLLPRRELVAGNAALWAGYQPIKLGGAAAAGLLVAAIGGLNALGIALVAYGLAGLLIGKMVAPEQAVRPSAVGQETRPYARPMEMVKVGIRDLAFSVYFIVKHPLLRAIAIAGIALSALYMPVFLYTIPPFLRENIGADAGAFNLLRDVRDVWILIALPAVPWLARRLGDGKLSLLAFAAIGVFLGLLANVGQLWQAFAVAALLGMLTAAMLPLRSVVQAETPDHLRGRVIANLATLNMLVLLGAGPMLAVLVNRMDARPIHAIVGLAIFLAGLALLRIKEIREVRLAAD